ncbi:phosphate/phosphite/phosphonate ABC transporter substrate-binding protein [Acidiferrobacter thiooxydans]|uniref:phosphate/phosphite/phosphonate ABC transporter substrate-binding protein n=1 Tax=Acidiferrobacter thiooxydans TaxID=163359 RepID=UPI00159F0739|nr:phosphate/phosphite/phosphonate ABC transporter substrate-binding protein [Acidiferrobacter thiooxydans]UEO00102.1 phosphate/phosphite/phosphonate ABC transporter substrate-binding protein [Acidiferrobacter thiooxydans]
MARLIGGTVLLAGMVGVPSAFAAPRVLTIGIVPQMSPWTLARRWTPVLEAWSAAVGVHIVLRTAPTIRRFERRVAHGDYDLVYLNPADYLRYRGRYRAFARGRGWLQGILVVRRKGPVRGISELAHRLIAFPARHAIAASVEPRRFLRARGIPFQTRYLGSHDAVYRAVAAGLFIAGGGVRQTYDSLPARIRRHLRVLWAGPKGLPHPFAARRTLPASLVRRLTVALVRLPRVVPGAVRRLGFTGFEATRDRDYTRPGAVVLMSR